MEYFEPNTKDFTSNGKELRFTKALLTMNLNGIWQLEVECLDNIEPNSIFRAETPFGKQLFRVPEKAIEIMPRKHGTRCTALPIFLDAKDEVFLFDSRAVNVNGQGALDTIFANSDKYTGVSNISKKSTAYWVRKNGIEALMSSDENSFVNRWGGEIYYDNYIIHVMDHVGNDNGMRVEAGFNLTGLKQTIDTSELCTVIVPVAYNGYTLPNNQMVESPRVNLYPKKYIKAVNFDNVRLKADLSDGEDTTGLIICETMNDVHNALISECKKQWGIVDVPKITYDANIVDLAKYDKYKDFKELVKSGLGDTIAVRNNQYDIEQKARVITLVFNCLTGETEKLTIGDYRRDFYQTTSSMQRVVGSCLNTATNTVIAEKVQGVLNGLNTQMKVQQNSAQKTDCRAILFEDSDPNSEMFGALSLGTQGIQISHEKDASGHWKWGTAINYQTIVADMIVAGVLTDKTGNFYLNLDTGKLVMNDGTFKGTIDTVKDVNVGRNINLSYDKNGYGFSKIGLGSGLPTLNFGYSSSNNYRSVSFHLNENDQGKNLISINNAGGKLNFLLTFGNTKISWTDGSNPHIITTVNGKKYDGYGFTGKIEIKKNIKSIAGLVTGGE